MVNTMKYKSQQGGWLWSKSPTPTPTPTPTPPTNSTSIPDPTPSNVDPSFLAAQARVNAVNADYNKQIYKDNADVRREDEMYERKKKLALRKQRLPTYSGRGKSTKATKKVVNSRRPVKNTTRKHTGVQAHGQEWEDDLLTVFVSPSKRELMNEVSYTSVHDIPKDLNRLSGRNVSVKATKTNRVDFGSALRTLDNVSNNSPLEAVVIKYRQVGNTKQPASVKRFDFTNAKEVLFGNHDIHTIREDFEELDSMVKTGDPKYKDKAKEIRQKMNKSYLSVAPKVGNPSKKRYGRLQISLANIDKLEKEHPELVINDEHCKDMKDCLRTLNSSVRTIGKKK